MHSDPTGHSAFPNWIKLLIGGIAIVGLGVGTCYTGGPLGVLFGAAFLGSLIGAAGGTLAGGLIGGAVTGKWSGFCNGASYGFMLGALIGAVVGAASVGSNMMFGDSKLRDPLKYAKEPFFIVWHPTLRREKCRCNTESIQESDLIEALAPPD